MMGKESLYYRFLKKFLDDENYVLLLKPQDKETAALPSGRPIR